MQVDGVLDDVGFFPTSDFGGGEQSVIPSPTRLSLHLQTNPVVVFDEKMQLASS
jgi:hypothetical protein